MRRKSLYFIIPISLILLSIFGYLWWDAQDQGDPTLTPFVHAHPPFPIVFTSRKDASSFCPHTSEGVAFSSPGMSYWNATEGRLRLLSTRGQVHELTWGRLLPDGSTLIDVMSPSVSPDGKSVVFAGRAIEKRFRIYSIDLSSRKIRQLTGTPDDPGCSALPPMRFAVDGNTLLSDDERKRQDYEDVDPIVLADGSLVFSSSRHPDLGGANKRRATQIWIKPPGKNPHSLTASRANDRWPFQLADGLLTFSLWSNQTEVINNEGTDLVRNPEERNGLTPVVDRWVGIGVQASGEFFGNMVKIPEPVWRPRPTPGGQIAFMTRRERRQIIPAVGEHPENERLYLAQAMPGTVTASPSSLATDSKYPKLKNNPVLWAPTKDADGAEWSLATPSPCPPTALVLSASKIVDDAVPLNGYGIHLIDQSNWSQQGPDKGTLKATLLFDDPNFVDAEPVVVYDRKIPVVSVDFPLAQPEEKVFTLQLLNGKTYQGKAGHLESQSIMLGFFADASWQLSDADQSPIVPAYPEGSIKKLRLYANHRDRFNDPTEPWIEGIFEPLLDIDVSNGQAKSPMPLGSPTMLVGIGADGKIAHQNGAADRAGHRGKFYALAGDHVSGVRPGGYHFCTGCHAGHSAPRRDPVPENR